MIDIDQQKIAAKKQKIEKIRRMLKKDFIGIDEVIDSLLDYISVWYLIPEILNRPVIVNLWGMTGVGKTDLIRKLVKYLDFQDRFTEVELSNVDSTSWDKSVSTVLTNQGFNDEKPSIVLFDEIQRFNTIDQDGKPITQTKFMDFWELLSDGKLSRKEKADLDYQIYNLISRQKENKKRTDAGEKIENNLNYWEAREIQKMLTLDGSVEEISMLTDEDGLNLLHSAKKKKKIYEPVNYAKCLIIISGNLDDAFSMATATSEADIDADIFNAFTKKITMVDVKNSLSRKFRPEQVARFGNIHMIYASLNKKNFQDLISQELKRIITDNKSRFGIKVTIDKSINELVYRNGVFPAQGVRPVFSSIADIVETNLSKYLYECIMNNYKSITIKYDPIKHLLIAQLDSHEIITPYIGRVDKIRDGNEQNAIANISVHESGHAVVYMALFNIVPLQLKSKLANSYAGGFTFPHQIHENKANLLNKIKIFLAGGLAEELIFGHNKASVGRSDDWHQLTMLATDYVRKYGFNDDFKANYSIEPYPYQLDKKITDPTVESLIKGLCNETMSILETHKSLLLDLSKELNKTGNLKPEEVLKIAKSHKLSPQIKEEGYLVIDTYNQELENNK